MAMLTTRVYNSMSDAPGAQPPLNMDFCQSPFNATIGVYIVSGEANYSVEFSLDDLAKEDVEPRWFEDPSLKSGSTFSGVTGFGFPVGGIRLNIASFTGVIELKVLQGFRA
jgi:hypothetical protein